MIPRIDVWPPLPFGTYARRPSKKLPFPLEDPRCRIFSLARHALFAGVESLGLRPGDEVLVPAYHHGSEVEALIRAGIVCRFYDIGPHLEPDEKDLEALLGSRVRALYLIHYLGLSQDSARWRTWCDERDLLLIEDAAQAWLGSREGMPIGSHGDLSIFCLYKTFGLPDGAAIVSSSPPRQPRSERKTEISRIVRLHGLYGAQRWKGVAQLWRWIAQSRRQLGRPARTGEHNPDRDFALGDPGRAPHVMTGFLLPRLARPEAQAVRAANYAFLLERLRRFVPEYFTALPQGSSPFAFPIWCERKEDLLQRLDQHNIVAENFWATPHPHLNVADFPRSAALRKSVIALPVHQGLSVGELERVADVVLEGLGCAQ